MLTQYYDGMHRTPIFSFIGFLIELKTADKINNISFVLICIENTLQKLNKAIKNNCFWADNRMRFFFFLRCGQAM